MARKKYSFNEARIQRFFQEGRGKGTGSHYKPWLTVSDVPSLGRVHRVFCPKTERVHHLMSDNEYCAFLIQWWNDSVIDIREQYPLIDRRETLEIAARCGVKHPVDPSSGALWVLTTDLLVTMKHAGRPAETVAYAVKQAEELAKARTLEKLEIELRYWERREVTWKILTDRQVKGPFTTNLSWILGSDGSHMNNLRYVDEAAVKRELASARQAQPETPIRLICKKIDHNLGYKSGSALAALRRLLGEKSITVNLHERSIPDLPAKVFAITGGFE
jgi:hypothetical protein